ncbi:MAG: FkbM family methyltransferase, partial [Sediminibacterium sp.]
MSQIKDAVRELLIFLHFDLTKNLKYDRLTRRIMKDGIQANFNCIDIGCHKGEMLNYMLKLAPQGKHFAFEPIPSLFNQLSSKYKNRAAIFPYALSNSSGETTFQWVKNAPAYSGIKRRRYDIDNPEIEEITVEKKLLDDVIPTTTPIHFVKIDVEGAEFGVLKGAKNLLAAHKPTILFECGKGASDFYDTNPLELTQLVKQPQADILIGGVKERPIAYKLGLGFCDHNHERKLALAGYEGMLNFAKEIYATAMSPVF